MEFDWESLQPYVAFILGMAILLGVSYRYRKTSGARAVYKGTQ